MRDNKPSLTMAIRCQTINLLTTIKTQRFMRFWHIWTSTWDNLLDSWRTFPVRIIECQTLKTFVLLVNLWFILEFNKLSSNDREELIRCSIHSAIVFAIYRGCDSTRVNYFNVDSAKFDKFVKLFPCFESCNVFMKKIREKFEKHQLDDREIALYLAMISFKPSLN